jgi:hypothetical protein
VLMVRTEKSELQVYDMQCQKRVVVSEGKDGPYQKFVLPPVTGWDMRLAIV